MRCVRRSNGAGHAGKQRVGILISLQAQIPAAATQLGREQCG